MEFRFRENLRDELNFQGMSVNDLSKATGISKRTIENYLGNKGTVPPLDYACRIAAALNISVETLAYGSDAITNRDELPAKQRLLINDIQKLSQENQDLIMLMIHSAAMEKK